MNHVDSSVTIHFSNEYARFKMINGNRPLNEGKIKRIIKEISNGNDMLRYYPIQVKENKDRLDILDGQHRFYISKYLKRPVFYILVKEEKSMPDIARVNSNVEKWKSSDFVNCYAQQENKHYIQLRDFMDTYGFSASVSLRLLYNGNAGAEGSNESLTEDFKNGAFVVKCFDEAYAIAEDCKKFSSFAYWKERGFVIAIDRIKRAAILSIDEVLKAYNKKPEMLTHQASFKEYIWNLEQIINMGKQKRIVIV